MAGIDPLLMIGFSNDLELLSQQLRPKLAQHCKAEMAVKGHESYRIMSQIAKTNATKRTSIFQPVDLTSPDTTGRWVFPERFISSNATDTLDRLRTMINPDGEIVRSSIAAMNRQMDTSFVEAFFGTSYVGKSGLTSVVFPASQQVAVTTGVGSATGLNVAKIVEAREILAEADVDLDYEEQWMAVSPKQYSDLLSQTQVTSTDFNARPVLTDGKVIKYLNFNIIESNLLPVDGDGYRRCPVWVSSGMACGLWQPVQGDIRELPDYVDKPIYIEVTAQFGFTRTEEVKCVEIKCAE
jgi:hypothetical protein